MSLRPACPRRRLALLACAAVLAALAPTAAAAPIRDKTPVVEDLILVPSDTQLLVVLRVAELWKTDLVKEAVKAIPGGADNPIKQMETEIGLTPADIERMTVVMRDPNSNHGTVILLTGKALDQKKVLAAMAKHSGATQEDRKVGAKTYHYFKAMNPNNPDVVYFVSDRVMVFGNESEVKAILEKPAGKHEGVVAAALDRANKKKDQMVFAMNLPRAQMDEAKKQFLDDYKVLADARGMVVGMSFAKSTIEMEVRGVFADEATARDAKKAVEEGKLALSGLMDIAKGSLPEKDLIKQVENVQSMLKNGKVSQTGKDVVFTSKLEIDVAAIKKMAGPIGGIGGPVPPVDPIPCPPGAIDGDVRIVIDP